MLWQLWLLGDGTHWVSLLWWERRHRAFVTSGNKWDKDSRLTREAFSSTINEPYLRLWVWNSFSIKLYKLVNCLVYPPSCLYVVQPGNNHLEFFVELHWHILDLVGMEFNVDTWNSFHNEACSNLSFERLDIFFPEKKLPI